MRARTILVGGAAAVMLALYFGAGSWFDSDDAGDHHKAKVSIAIDGDSKTVTKVAEIDGSEVTIVASTDPGKLAIKLPGGFEAKLPMPDSIADGNKFDIDGVGLYPGARVDTINVNADKKGDPSGDKAVVMLGFAAPASAETVAGWYEGQFQSKDIAVQRKGTLLTGKTDDGDDFALLLTDIAGGRAKGQLTIHDRK